VSSVRLSPAKGRTENGPSGHNLPKLDRPSSTSSLKSAGAIVVKTNASSPLPSRPTSRSRAGTTDKKSAVVGRNQASSPQPNRLTSGVRARTTDKEQTVASKHQESSHRTGRPTSGARAGTKVDKNAVADQHEESGHSQEVTILHIDRKAEEENRAAIAQFLAKVPSLDPIEDPRSFHGRVFEIPRGAAAEATAKAAKPQLVWKSSKKPRQHSPDWLTASEYADSAKVLEMKVKLFASLLRASRRTLAYTGAGLSVAAGIGMAAVGSSGGGGMGVATAGEPTLAHCVMAELNRQQLLHGWVQQNHDGLPQKAGYRQEDINEIHGSWFDPSNPVVKYSGTLRSDLCDDMEMNAEKADLVIVLGTSLTGLNADQCVTTAAEKSLKGDALGSVIISPQRTPQDGDATLRIFAKADHVMEALVKELGLGSRAIGKIRGVKQSYDLFTKTDRVKVPYNKHGVHSKNVWMWWDLSPGQKVRIGSNNNLRGAHQPNDKDISINTVGTVDGRDRATCSIKVKIGGTVKKLGLWWLETAVRGGVSHLPLVNVDAEEIPV